MYALSMAIRGAGPMWQALRCNEGPGVVHSLPPSRTAGAVSRPPQKLEILSKTVLTIGFWVMYAFFKCVSGTFPQALTQSANLE